MPSIYCPSCGEPNQHSGIKPKFCGFCAEPLTLEAAPQSSQASIKRVPAGRRAIPHEPEPEHTLPDIQKLDVEITVEEPFRETVGQVWASGATGVSRQKPKRVNKKDALDNLKKSIFETKRIDLNPND